MEGVFAMNRNGASARRFLAWAAFAALLFGFRLTAATAESPPHREAELKVSGYGWLGNLRIKRMLRLLQPGKTVPEFLGASYVEDAASLIISRLREDGYLQPTVAVELTLDDGTRTSRTWDASMTELLPRPLRARKAHFKITKGVRFYFHRLEFSGIAAIPERKARAYFVETGGLFSLKGNRIFSPQKLNRGVAGLRDRLQRLGYRDASVTAGQVNRNDRNGAVDVRVDVNQGLKYIVRSVRIDAAIENTNAPATLRTNWPAQPWSPWWEQDYAVGLKTNFFHLGYPDTTVRFQTLQQEPETNVVQVDLAATIQSGPFVRTGKVRFEGAHHTKRSVLARRAPLQTGQALDRIRAEHGRYRLSRLGVFDSVSLKYDPVDEHTRDITYQLEEGKRFDVSLLFGYGSYEMLRGGVQFDQYNVFGRAHHQQLKVTQSFKSSGVDYVYTMPEFFGEDVDVFGNASWLHRQEISFTRVEYGGDAGLRKFFRNADTDVSVRYNYQILEANGAPTNLFLEGVQNSGVGSVITEINHDRRDNPLYPHHGYRIFTTVEVASEYLASDVNYQRFDLSLSWHHPITDSQWIHLGLSHGAVATAGSVSADLPFNRRFFPGGDNSVRGFQQGEAAPRDATGKIIGAETYLQGNIEFEQGLTPQWSLVLFVDGVGFARDLKDYPADEELFSIGGGVQWKTIVGPVRLEYGYNLNPRPRDPIGTLHFSLGFPF